MDNNLYDLFSLDTPRTAIPDNAPQPVAPPTEQALYTLNFSTEQSTSQPPEVAPPLPQEEIAIQTPRPTPAVIALAEIALSRDVKPPVIETVAEEIPSEILLTAQESISSVLSYNPKPRIRTKQFLDRAFSARRVNPTVFTFFKQALRQDERLLHLGDGEFEVVERTIIQTSSDWLRSWQPDLREIEEVKELVLDTAASKLRKPFLTEYAIIDTVSKAGIYLLNEELPLLMASLATDTRITFDRSGTMQLRERLPPRGKPAEIPQAPQSLSPRQIMKALQNIDQTDEMSRARDLATNKATSRGKRKKYGRKSGRHHGKKLTFEQQVAELK